MKPRQIITYNPTGPSGNIFLILSKARQALLRENLTVEWEELRQKVEKSHSYEQALKHISDYVNLEKEN